MVVVFFILAGILLVVLQTTVFMSSPVSSFSPDLHYVFVAYLALRLDLVRSLLILFPLVCVLDVLSGTVLGTYALSCFSGYFLLQQISSKLPVNELLYQIPLISLIYLAVSWALYLFLEFFAPGQQAAWAWWKMVIHMVLVAGATYPLFFLFDLLQKYSHRDFLPRNKLRLRSDNRRRRTT